MRTLFLLLFPVLLAAQPTVFTVTIARDSNATAYTAGDAVSARSDSLLERIIAATELGRGEIKMVELYADTVNTTNATFRVWFLSDTSGFGKVADNAALNMTSAKFANVIGYSDMTLETTGSASSTAAYDVNVGAQIFFNRTYATSASGVYVLLTATGAYTPKSGGVFTVKVTAEPWK